MSSGNAASLIKGRQRAREERLARARERRHQLDPDRLARDQRIDEATVDVEEACDAWKAARAALDGAEQALAARVERLISEKLTVTEAGELTGLDHATVRRLRQLRVASGQGEKGPLA